MSGRGHRKLRLSSRKSYERKKYRTAPRTLLVSIPRTVVSATVPQDHPSQSLTVSLPISAFQDAPLVTVSVVVEEDLSYTVSFQGTAVNLWKCAVMSILPSSITSGTQYTMCMVLLCSEVAY